MAGLIKSFGLEKILRYFPPLVTGPMIIAIGVKYGADDNVSIGPIHFSGLALAALIGVLLNAILPGKLGMKIKSVHGKDKQQHQIE